MRPTLLILTLLLPALAAWLLSRGEWVFGSIAAVAALASAARLWAAVRSSERHFATLLEALRNSDASMRFITPDRRLSSNLNAIMDSLTSMRMAMQSREQHYSRLLARIDSGVLVADSGPRITLANPRASELLGPAILTHAGQLQSVAPRLASILEQGVESASMQLTLDSPRRVLDITVSPLPADAGGGRLVVVNDVTRSMDAAEAESWIRLSRVLNHEIVNSLTPIMSLCNTLRHASAEAGLPPDVSRALTVIALTGESLRAFVAGFKSFTSLPEPQPRVEPLEPLLRAVAESVAPVAPGTDIRVECDPSLLVCTDPALLLRALICVGSNAVRYAAGAPGRRTPTVEIKAATLPDGSVTVTIANNGEPVAPDMTDRIFTPFFTTAADPDGRGIGLALARHIMTRLGGALTLRSSTLALTTFAFTLP